MDMEWNLVCQNFETRAKGCGVESVEEAVADITAKFAREPVNLVYLFAHDEDCIPDLDCDGCTDEEWNVVERLPKQVAFERRYCDGYATLRALIDSLDRSLSEIGIKVIIDTGDCRGLEESHEAG
jgi:hypothetical protein